MTFAYQEHYTVEDYRQWQGDWELFAGMPYAMTPSPSVTHQMVIVNAVSRFKLAIDEHVGCGHCIVLAATDWQISNDTVVRPDAMILCREAGDRVLVTPDVIMEVVSPSSTKRDEQMKFERYAREGVAYYLLAYPESRLLKLYRNGAEGFRKLGDYTDEPVELVLGQCPLSIDTARFWR